MRRTLLFAVFFLLPTTGCALPADNWGVVDAVWNKFPWWSVIWRLAFWTALGASIGLTIGIFLTRRLQKWGLYRLPWPRLRYWLTALIFTFNIIAMPILFGAIGFFEGAYRATEAAVRWSVVGQEWLPKVGAVGADAIAFADDWVEKGNGDWNEIQKRRRPVNVVRLVDKLDAIDDGVAAKLTAFAKRDLLESYPDWKDSNAEASIDWMLRHLIRYLLNRKLQGKLADFGVPDVWTELAREARKDGDDELTHEELTAFLTERVMIPLILYPIKRWLSGYQFIAVIVILIWFITPPVSMWIARAIAAWWKRRQIRRMCVDRL